MTPSGMNRLNDSHWRASAGGSVFKYELRQTN